MSEKSYETLRNAKSALEEGLILQEDFDAVKSAFLKAQQLRAGLDAGFIREADYQAVKSAFLHSLNLSAAPQALADALPANGHTAHDPQREAMLPSTSQPSSTDASGAAGAVTSTSHSAMPAGVPAATLPPSRSASSVHSGMAGVTSSAPPSQEPSPRGRTVVPTNIPKMGGARPKQTAGTSMSGICVTDDAVNLYYYLKAKSVYRWATWRINDAGKEVIISEVGEKDSTYADFLASLPSSDCRYGVIDMQFTNSEGCIFNKILFINWAPDTARIKSKMMYASTKDFFKGFLDGLSIELQGSDLDDISEQEANTAVRSSVTRQ